LEQWVALALLHMHNMHAFACIYMHMPLIFRNE